MDPTTTIEAAKTVVLQNQGIATLVLITVATNLGLLIAALIAGAMNQVRVRRAMAALQATEDRILARLLILTERMVPPEEVVRKGTLEEMIQADLMALTQGQDQTIPTEAEMMALMDQMTASPLDPERETNQPTTVKAETTARVENPET